MIVKRWQNAQMSKRPQTFETFLFKKGGGAQGPSVLGKLSFPNVLCQAVLDRVSEAAAMVENLTLGNGQEDPERKNK